MVVQTNILAINTHRNMKNIGVLQEKTSSRLSSGYRVNTAADDAAGLAISEKMRAQIRGLDQASRNALDAISLIQTAEGGMQEIDNMVQRIRELVVQVSNDTNEHNGQGTGDRQKIQDEINQLIEEIDSMSDRVEFNQKKVINGTYADANEMWQFSVMKFNHASMQTTMYSTMAVIASSTASAQSAAMGSASMTLNGAASALAAAKASGTPEALLSADKAYNEAGKAFASAVTAYTKARQELLVYTAYTSEWTAVTASASAQVVSWSNTAASQVTPNGLFMQVGANAAQGVWINIGKVKTDLMGIGDGRGKSEIDVLQRTGGETTGILDRLDLALTYVTTQRAKLGAMQNRIEFTSRSLDISSENLSAAESRIRNADMAKEMMALTKANVLQQAAVSMLAQANQNPQSILQLLR